MAKVKIMVSGSGGGKSTYIAKHFPTAEICSADHAHIDPVTGLYQYKVENQGRAHGTCLKKYVVLVHTHNPKSSTIIVVDNTNTTVGEIAPYAALALAYGHELELIVIKTPWEVAAERNVHKVPRSTVKAMFERLERLLKHLPPYWPVKEVSGVG
jgi:predicted kinase